MNYDTRTLQTMQKEMATVLESRENEEHTLESDDENSNGFNKNANENSINDDETPANETKVDQTFESNDDINNHETSANETKADQTFEINDESTNDNAESDMNNVNDDETPDDEKQNHTKLEWFPLITFISNDLFLEYIKKENFARGASRTTKFLTNTYLRCNLVKKDGPQCAARLRLTMQKDEISWQVYTNRQAHTRRNQE